MSDYQAAWITEEDLQDLADDGSDSDAAQTERQGGAAEPSLGEFGMEGAVSMADLDEEDDQTDDMQVLHEPISCPSMYDIIIATVLHMPFVLLAGKSL